MGDCLVPSWEQAIYPTFDADTRNALALADFDGDGKPDLATIGYSQNAPNQNITVFRGNGDGTLGAPVAVHQAAPILELLADDLNGDGKADLLTTRRPGGLIFVPGNGDGTFAAPILSPSPADASLAIAELTGDAFRDVAAVSWDPAGPDYLVVLAGDGSGSFTEVHRQELARDTYAVATGDLDDDGAADLVISFDAHNAIEVLYGNGDGTFDEAESLQSGLFATAVTVADADDDGDPDILAPNWDDQTVSVHRNQGQREFDAADVYGVATPATEYGDPNSATAGDVTGDGVTDLLVGAVNGGFVAVLRGLGDGTFEAASYHFLFGGGFYNTVIGPVALADLDADGRPDLITTSRGSGTVIVARNHCGDLSDIDVTPRTPVISVGQSAKFSVSLHTYDSIPPTGQVSIVEGEAVVATASLVNGTATATVSGLSAGDHSLVVRYAGDAQYEPAQSAPVVQHVTTETTTTTLATAPSQSVYGQSVRLTASVTSSDGTTPGGTIEYGLGTIDTTGAAPVATRDESLLPVGTHGGHARYRGDETHPPSEAPSFTHTVAKAATSNVLETLTRLNNSGSRILITFGVHPQYSGHATGTVQLFDGTVMIASKQKDDDRPWVVFEVEGLAPGRHDFRLGYPGDQNFHGSESASVTYVVFSDEPLLPRMTVRAAHLQEIIDATNDLRAKAGQSAVAFNDFGAGQPIRATHITTLRTKINEARTALGAAAVSFTRAIAPGATILAQDLQELRDAVH
jgi:Bacterial Ig-like domain (group 3)/FG-GAP-like repeat